MALGAETPLHSAIQAASGDLFADGHFESSVSEAFKSVEVRVRDLTGSKKSGAALMGDAFKADGSVLDVAEHEGRSGEDEREGFMHVFRGAMIGIRNPRAHELFKPGDPQQALEYLGFASLLHRGSRPPRQSGGNQWRSSTRTPTGFLPTWTRSTATG